MLFVENWILKLGNDLDYKEIEVMIIFYLIWISSLGRKELVVLKFEKCIGFFYLFY